MGGHVEGSPEKIEIGNRRLFHTSCIHGQISSLFLQGLQEAVDGRDVKKELRKNDLHFFAALLCFAVRHLGFRCLVGMVQYLVGQIQPECFMIFHVLDKAV